MTTPSPKPRTPFDSSARAKRLARKIAVLVVLGLGLGWVYDYAVPRLYQPGQRAGFPVGVVHGALMPVALPALLLGRDVPIYSSGPTGRDYKIGYIAGINLCGLVFFGTAFAHPPSPRA